MANTTLENHIPSSTLESGKSAEQLLDEQLQAAGLINISNKVKEWIASSPIALNEVGRLADKGFGAQIESNTSAQGLLHSAFAEAMALEKLRQDGPARELPLDVHEVIQSTEPEGAREHVVDGAVIPNDLSSLDAVPQPTVQEPALRTVDHLEQTAASSPAPLVAPAESVASTLRRENNSGTTIQETATDEESQSWFQRVRTIGKKSVASALIAGAAATGVGAGVAKFISLEGQPQSVATALELAAQEKTLEEKKNFFDGAVDVHTLPGRIGNNFGPAVTYEDLRIDTPEFREKTLHGFSEMLRGNTDIMVAYMYTFGQAGDKITQENAAQRLQQLKDLAAFLKDEKNIGARYDAHQKVMEVLNTIEGGGQGKFGPEHISWYIGPDNRLGLDNSVLDNGAEFVGYSVDLLPDANPTFSKDALIDVLKNCGRQLGTEELQQLVQFLISKKAPVITTTTFAPSPITQIPSNWNTYPGGGGGGGGGGGYTPPETPTPETPEEENTPKSSNVEDYQRPGTDDTTDSGVGEKPRVEEVKTPADEKPPKVDQEEDVDDSPSSRRSSESDDEDKPARKVSVNDKPGSEAPTAGRGADKNPDTGLGNGKKKEDQSDGGSAKSGDTGKPE